MSGSVAKYLRFGLIASLGAVCMAGLFEFVWSFTPAPASVAQVQCQETAMVLALDKSYSMVEAGSPSLQLVREAVQRFVAAAQQDVCLTTKQFGLVTFNQEADLDVPLGSQLESFDTVIGQLNPVLGDSTVIEAGVATAVDALRAEPFADSRVLFLLTDAENFGSDAPSLGAELRSALAGGIDVYAVITNEGDHADTMRDVLGQDRVRMVDDGDMGAAFFEQASSSVLENPVVAADRALPPLHAYLYTGLWTGLVAFGIALALLVFLNRYNMRARWISAREIGAVAVSFVAGFAAGVLVQYLFSTAALGAFFVREGGVLVRHVGDLVTWSLIGLLLAFSLSAFRVLPNLKPLNAILFGVAGGLAAGILYTVARDLFAGAAFMAMPRLVGAAGLGLSIGLAMALLGETSPRFPIWLRVLYMSDRVYRYHAIGSTPIAVGGGREADVYVQSDHEKLWEFWVEKGTLKVKNFYADKTRAIDFADVLSLGSIELKDMKLDIVGDRGPETGSSHTGAPRGAA